MSDLTILTVCPNNSADLLDLWKTGAQKHFPGAPLIIEKPNRSLPIGSRQHGDGLNRAIQKVKTSHVLILDLDCVLLDGKWFNTDIEVLGCRKNNKFETMHAMFICGRSDILKSYDFNPHGKGPNFNASNDVASQLGLLNNDLEVVNCRFGKCSNFSSDVQCTEVYYEGRLIASHLGRGSNMAGRVKKTKLSNQEQRLVWVKKIRELNK